MDNDVKEFNGGWASKVLIIYELICSINIKIKLRKIGRK